MKNKKFVILWQTFRNSPNFHLDAFILYTLAQILYYVYKSLHDFDDLHSQNPIFWFQMTEAFLKQACGDSTYSNCGVDPIRTNLTEITATN